MYNDLLKKDKISHYARIKVINDFFPHAKDIEKEIVDSKELAIHAGALCLYAATLITRIHETNTEDIKIESNERELALQEIIKNTPKYSHYTEMQVKQQAHSMIIKDIRNSFAHGNFEISYDINKKDLFFILHPRRKDIVIEEPIIISQESLKDAIMKPIFELSLKLMDGGEKEINRQLSSSLDRLLKSIMLPTQMLKISDYYLEKTNIMNPKLNIDKKRYNLIQYTLLVTQITYEQDDYYKIFGANSDIFNKISLVRNTLAHDSFILSSLASNVDYEDKDRTMNEPLNQSIVSLLLANLLKETIKSTFNKGHKEESINELKNQLTNCFKIFFNNIKKENKHNIKR